MKDPDQAVSALAEAVASLDVEVVTDGTLRDLAARHRTIMEAAAALADVRDSLAQAIAEVMEEDVVVVAGVGNLTRRPKTSATWIDDQARERMMEDAARAFIGRVAVDPATGEIHGPIAQAVRETWRLVQDAFSISADPKVGFRKVLGLAPDDYRAKRRTGYTVAISEEGI